MELSQGMAVLGQAWLFLASGWRVGLQELQQLQRQRSLSHLGTRGRAF